MAEHSSYVEEIQLMMHAFGDVSQPSLESAQIVEKTVLQQMSAIWSAVSAIATMYEAPKPALEHFLFLLRKHPRKFRRLVRYIKRQCQICEIKNPSGQSGVNSKSNRYKRCMEFIAIMDINCANSETWDEVEIRRRQRAVLMEQHLTAEKYTNFIKARAVSFGHGRSGGHDRFCEFLARSGIKMPISDEACDLMAFLAYEALAELVDLALLVKEEEEQHSELPRAPGSSLITTSEIREAVRRAQNTQTLPGCLFAKGCPRCVGFKKVLLPKNASRPCRLNRKALKLRAIRKIMCRLFYNKCN